ncbi:MAG: hypothetical protein IJT44_11625 [Clostridia bacterium]|nr:hypothetical protein [Clostridia bacterium]
MGTISLLDCTLRDGGYVNDWRFGAETVRGFAHKIAQTGVEMFEVGFLKGDTFDKDRAVFPDGGSAMRAVGEKQPGLLYLGMLDMSAPIPLARFPRRSEQTLDGVRVIFKKEKTDEAFRCCEALQALGYMVFVNFVGTDLYTDAEFIAGIEKFNALRPFAMTIVDSFGLIKRKDFLRFVYLADHNMAPGVALGYHAHNNLQQAMGNAQALCEMNLHRDLCIDACVFGMGRGAGNLNLELFAEYMNENYGTHYRIEPMLEIMDEHLNEIYRDRFWGYSLPLYLSATNACHPNYAIYLAQKNTLTVKAFGELLQGIPPEDKARFSKEKAERYYRAFQENYIDDRAAIEALRTAFAGRKVLMLAPGRTLRTCADTIDACIRQQDPIVLAVNFTGGQVQPDYIFSSNMRRFVKIRGRTAAKCITTSNMTDCGQTDYVVNFSSFASAEPDVIDNSGLMALRLLCRLGVRDVLLAGMDGYASDSADNYADESMEYVFEVGAAARNRLISRELSEIAGQIRLQFLTPTHYTTGAGREGFYE